MRTATAALLPQQLVLPKQFPLYHGSYCSQQALLLPQQLQLPHQLPHRCTTAIANTTLPLLLLQRLLTTNSAADTPGRVVGTARNSRFYQYCQTQQTMPGATGTITCLVQQAPFTTSDTTRYSSYYHHGCCSYSSHKQQQILPQQILLLEQILLLLQQSHYHSSCCHCHRSVAVTPPAIGNGTGNVIGNCSKQRQQ